MHGGARALGARAADARAADARALGARAADAGALGARTSHPHAGMWPNQIRAPQSFLADTRLSCLLDREGRARQLGR